MTNTLETRLARFRWISFSLCMIGYILAFFHRQVPATLSAELQQDFQASGSQLGALAASYFYVYAAMQIPLGVASDRMGARHLVSWGLLVTGIGTILFGMANTLVAASMGRFLIGLGVSGMFLSQMQLIGSWFPERRYGSVTGISLLIGNMGSVLAATPFALLITVVSWRSAMNGLGILALVASLLAWRYLVNRPEEVGLPSMRELDGKPAHAAATLPWWQALGHVLRNRYTWYTVLPNLGVIGSMFSFAGLWAVPYLRDIYHYGPPLATAHTGLLLLGFAIGALIWGMISDRLHRRKPLVLGGTLAYLILWIPVLAGWHLPLAATLLMFFAMGFTSAGVTLTWAAAREVNEPSSSGMAIGVSNTGVFAGSALLQPLTGRIMDSFWDGHLAAGVRVYTEAAYRIGFAVTGLLILAGLLSACMMRETHCRFINDPAHSVP